ncbi:uncharacterized protein LOC135196384 [Macrobrachium nipponense]|uniref:uncharacterized protein LOC135196384 n=1 Tax=Macrobrachium nipponense TaxID=159736 RepID=UPI0030C7F139
MASPNNTTISSAVRELANVSAEDEPDVTETLNRIMEDPTWENVLEEAAVEGSFEGSPSSFLASGHTQQTLGNSIVPVENSVHVENLIDLFTGEVTGEEEKNRICVATVSKQESLEQCFTSLVKNVGVDEQRVEKPKLPQEDIKREVTFPLYPWRRVPKRPDFTKGGVGNPDCFLGIPSSPQDVGVHEVPTSPQTNGLHEVPRCPRANESPHKRKDREEHLSVIGINKQVIKRERLGESSWSCKPIESNTNPPVKSEAAVINSASLYPNLQESFSEGTSSRGSSHEHLFYYALGGFESSTESSRGEKRERS